MTRGTLGKKWTQYGALEKGQAEGKKGKIIREVWGKMRPRGEKRRKEVSAGRGAGEGSCSLLGKGQKIKNQNLSRFRKKDGRREKKNVAPRIEGLDQGDRCATKGWGEQGMSNLQ